MLLSLLLACNPDPGDAEQGIDYRTGEDGGPMSGERGTIQISEIGWAGSITNDGDFDPFDVFVEVVNLSNRPTRLDGWRIVEQGGLNLTFEIPEDTGVTIDVGSRLVIAAKDDGCFDSDIVIDSLRFPRGGDGFELTLYDHDDRLLEPVGSEDMPPFAGVYDGEVTRSMERAELMFGAEGSFPHVWHHYTLTEVDTPNNDRVVGDCRQRTLASPGRPNSPDYSGGTSSGSFE